MRRHGFTLIEVSIAVFIIAMLIAVSVPAFVRSFNSMSLRESVRMFSTTCQLARIEAVQRQRIVTFHADLDRQVFWLTHPGGSSGDTNLVDDVTVKSYEIPKRVRLVSVTLAEPGSETDRIVAIQFYPNGTCDGATAVFTGNEPGALAATVDPITCRAEAYPIKP